MTDPKLIQIAAELDGVTPDVMALIDAAHRHYTARLDRQGGTLGSLSARLDLEQQINDRQDQALTELESAAAELGRLFDRITQLERCVEDIRRMLAACNVRMLS